MALSASECLPYLTPFERPARCASLHSFATRLFFAVLLVGLSALCSGQISNVSDVESTPVPGAGHNYMGVLNETVNPANGSLSLRINVPVPKGRLLTPPFSIAYDSNGATPDISYSGKSGSLPPFFQTGWSLTVPSLSHAPNVHHSLHEESCEVSSGYVFYGPDGSRHALSSPVPNSSTGMGLVLAPGQGCEDQGYYTSTTGMDPLVLATSLNTVQDADGTTYSFGGGSGPSTIEDRNGNVVQYSINGTALTVTDTAGRTTPAAISTDGFGGPGNTHLTLSGQGASYTLGWSTTGWGYTNGLSPAYSPNPSDPCPPGISGNPSDWYTPYVISSITLPNGKAYHFYYNSTYGLLNEIDYPTGAKVVYTWDINSQPNEMAIGSGTGPTGQPFSCQWVYATPVITERDIYYDGSTLAEVQTFSYQTNWGASGTDQAGVWSTKTTTVTTTDKVRSASFTTAYTYTPFPTPIFPYATTAFGTQVPVESQVVYNNYDGRWLKTVNKQWYNQYLLRSEQTVIPNGTQNGLASQVNYSYGVLGVPTEKDEYDYGQSGITRSAVTNYQSFGANALGSTIYDRPSQTLVYNGTPIAQHLAAETDYSYDSGTIVSAGGNTLTGHDETNFGTNSSSPRGNLTRVIKQCFPTASCPAGNPTTTYTYDETGQPVTMTDPRSNTTTYSFADSFQSTNLGSFTTTAGAPPAGTVTNAFLTKITLPHTGSNTSHIETFTYGYNDGELTTSTDQNSQTTTYRYNDYLDRFTETDHPDSGETSVSYNDAPPNPSTTTTTLIRSGVSLVSTSQMDGIGHLVQTQLTSDPDGPTYTATSYDGVGMPYKVWNPTRCSPPTVQCQGETTWGFTTYLYDDLSRTLSITKPDNSAATTSYSADSSGALTTVTDEAGRKRTSRTDSFGRITYVWEDPSGLNYQTSYQYNALNDLVGVTQNGSDYTKARVRGFGYNSLAQLTSATNPESGTLAYTYDANGNALSKTAPTPNCPAIQSGCSGQTVTTSYAYDQLNRLTSKSYSLSSMPTILYGYDGVALTGCTTAPPSLSPPDYPVGLRTSMCDGTGGIYGSGATSWSHDKMGRVLSQQQSQVTSTSGTTVTKGLSYGYNLDGSANAITYPSGNVVSYAVGGADRATQVSDSSNSYASYSASLGGPEYAPHGSLQSALNAYAGPSTGITISNSYNNRLQPATFSASNSTQTIFSLSYGFNPGHDNGTVVQIVNGVRSDATANMVFSYDSLNRLVQANTTTTGTNCWGEVYTIDSWGDLTNIAGVQSMGSCLTETLNNYVTNAKNQVDGFCYDVAGNLLDMGTCNTEAHSFVYDAEGHLQSPPVSGVNVQLSYVYYYDGDGNRVQKCDANPCTSATTAGMLYWRGADGAVLGESSRVGVGTMQQEYIYFNGERIARRDSGTGNVHFYLSDQLGSASVIVSGSSYSVQQQTDYYPFGGIAYSSGSDTNRYKFTGKERDAESGLDNFGARYYASIAGRFMTPDWAARPTAVPYALFGDPQSLNLYTYVRNDPVSKADADGHGVVDYIGGTWCDWKGCTNPNASSEKHSSQKTAQNSSQPSAQNTLSGTSQDKSWMQKLKNFFFSDPCGTNQECVTVYASPDTSPVWRAWLTATAPMQKAADWADSHPLLIFPVAVAAAFKGDEGPIEADEQTAEEYISKYLKGGVRSEFPGQFMNTAIKDIQALAKSGDRAARSAMKLLTDGRFKK